MESLGQEYSGATGHKSKKQGKKGCWLRLLTGVALFVLVAVVALLVNHLYSNRNLDTKLESLVNAEFDRSAMADNVSEHAGEFATKLRTAFGNANVCDDSGKIDFDVLMAEGSTLSAEWTLNRYDFAIFCSERNGLWLQSGENVPAIVYWLKIVQIDWEISNNVITYKIVYSVSGKNLAKIVNIKSQPEVVYITATATIDFRSSTPVKSVGFVVNQLRGEDNEYCLKKILGGGDFTSTKQTAFAYLPFDYIRELNSLWKTKMQILTDAIALYK